MQNKGKAQKPVEVVRKPIIRGSWYGKDAWKLALKRVLTYVGITFIYLIAGALLSFESLWARTLVAAMIVAAVAYYQFAAGMTRGSGDVAYGEIIYDRRATGHEVPEKECERSFHPLKGFFATLVAGIPFVVFCVVYAFLTEKSTYQLGVLPAWTEGMMAHTEFGAALSYYTLHTGMEPIDMMRIIDRAMIMPFIHVATGISADATLLIERLSGLLVLVAPMGYALGYMRGQNLRDTINTGIKMGDDKKKRRERKARKKRQRSSAPERLI